MPTRSALLARGTVPAGQRKAVLLVPAGRTAIVKEMRLWYLASGTGQALVWTNLGPASSFLLAWRALTAEEIWNPPLWTVLPAGGTLEVEARGTAALALWISGAQLPGVGEAWPIPGTLPAPEPDD